MASSSQVAMSGLGLKNQVAVGDGSVTVPSVSFAGDSNTGLYRPGADVLGVVTGGVERMRVDAAGNVGIGMETPGMKVDVAGNVRASKLLLGTSTDATRYISALDSNMANASVKYIAFGKANNSYNQAEASYFHVADGNTSNTLSLGLHTVPQLLNIMGNGNVGVGTTIPQARLHCAGTIRTQTGYLVSTGKYLVGDVSGDGSSSANPALSGWHLAQLNKLYSLSLTNGYYWIQSPAMPNPLQMYVDFNADGGGYDFYRFTGASNMNYVFGDHGARSLGLDLFYPRSKAHWSSIHNFVVNVCGSTVANDVKVAGAVYRDKTSAPNGSGGSNTNYTSYIMRDPRYYAGGAPDWRVPDGGKWFLRDSVYGEPNGDYWFYAFLTLFTLNSSGDITFNDGSGSPTTGTTIICSTNVKGSMPVYF